MKILQYLLFSVTAYRVYVYPERVLSLFFGKWDKHYIYGLATTNNCSFELNNLIYMFFENINLGNIINENVFFYTVLDRSVEIDKNINLINQIDYKNLKYDRHTKVNSVLSLCGGLDDFNVVKLKVNTIIIRFYCEFNVKFYKKWYLLSASKALIKAMSDCGLKTIYVFETTNKLPVYWLDFLLRESED